MEQVFIVNLPERKDRRTSIVSDFAAHEGFTCKIIAPVKDIRPAKSLWLTLKQIIEIEVDWSKDYFIFCEDDHQFTKHFSIDFLRLCIGEARRLNADILSGGVSWQRTSIQVTDNLFWIEKFSGLQFTIIFRKFYDTIMSATFTQEDVADHKLSSLTENKFVMFPAISVQREFGYSDVTPVNNAVGRVDFLFERTNQILHSLQQIRLAYNKSAPSSFDLTNFNEISLPVYITGLKNGAERFMKIQRQFAGRQEFELNFVESPERKNETVEQWDSIVISVKKAIENGDDFFILCEADHEFTGCYNRDNFVRHIIGAYTQKADLLSGGIGGFGVAMPVNQQRYWIDWLWCTQFIVIFRQFYQQILSYNFQKTDKPDSVFSKLSKNKMVIHPFISSPTSFDNSNIANNLKGKAPQIFKQADKRFQIYEKIHARFSNK